MTRIRIVTALVALVFVGAARPWTMAAEPQGIAPVKDDKAARIRQADMEEWLRYLSSDDLQGRQVFTEGYGLAAAYVADHLKAWGVTPLGDGGGYFQPVKQRGYRVTSRSSVTVEVNGQSRTFVHGDHVTFPANSGGKQTLTFDGAEFAGYGQVSATSVYDDFRGRDVKGRLVVSVLGTPAALVQAGGGRGGATYATGTLGAAATITYVPGPAAPTAAETALAKARAAVTQATEALAEAEQAVRPVPAGRGGRGAAPPAAGRGAATPAAFTTTRSVETPTTPQILADDTFFEFLFSNAPTSFADLKAKAQRNEPLSGFALPAAKVTISVDQGYEIVATQLTKNVVGMVRGSDPTLRDTYVMFGAHLDHIGYSQIGRGNGPAPGACRQRAPAAQDAVVKAGRTVQNAGRRGGAPAAPATAAPAPFDLRDVIYNGADDDGSGSTALLAIAKAFATGPKPKRSVVFIWHAGEESQLQGSRYNADFPVVPLDKVQVQLNIDMVGRDDCDNLEGDYTNSVFVVGADRISTDLHNLIVRTNAGMPRPMTLDYELNDVNDPENIYTRSDHYSYASKGIPIAFFTTGLHADYHRVSDTVDKILFPKMTRITQLIYETGLAIANADRVLTRDRQGARTGFGTKSDVLLK